MDKSENLLNEIHTFFPTDTRDVRGIAPLKLAYLGDAVFEILVRTLTVERTGGPVKKMHSHTSSLVNAKSQARLVLAMQDQLTEEEMAVFHRGRNAKASSVAKNADIHDYRNATGLEALFGYLYLEGKSARAVELLKYAAQSLEIPL